MNTYIVFCAVEVSVTPCMGSILIEKRPINVANILSEDRENLLIPSLGEYILLATPHKVFAMFLNSFMGEA